MATLHLICGLPGSGKSTLARKLEMENKALRLTPDEWMAKIVGDGHDAAKRSAVESVQWDVADRVLRLGIDVVLEFGFWSRKERDDYRAKAGAAGAATRLYFLDVPRKELWRRIENRNAQLNESEFHINQADLDDWLTRFEKPTADELQFYSV